MESGRQLAAKIRANKNHSHILSEQEAGALIEADRAALLREAAERGKKYILAHTYTQWQTNHLKNLIAAILGTEEKQG